MSSQDRVRVGLAGLGRFGSLHTRILSRLGEAELVAVCDPSSEARSWAQRELGVPNAFESFDELLAVSDLDAVFIVTPEELHAEQALASIARGLPTFMEKPVSTSSSDAARVVESAAAAGIF